jgi:hypothetical protein
MKKKKNKGWWRIVCFRPIKAPVGYPDVSEGSVRTILSVLSLILLFANSFFFHFQHVLAVELPPSAPTHRMCRQLIPRAMQAIRNRQSITSLLASQLAKLEIKKSAKSSTLRLAPKSGVTLSKGQQADTAERVVIRKTSRSISCRK